MDNSLVNKERNPEVELVGAWETILSNGEGVDVTAVTIIADGFLSTALYDEDKKEFTGTYGGAWKIDGNTFSIIFEYDTMDPTRVGKTLTRTFRYDGKQLSFNDDEESWSRIDYGTPGALAGAYLITGRERNGEMSHWTPGARKTMKILSGTRFQWIAYNTETAEFSGTGGGTYTTIDGKYVEHIKFFSRDGSRVGASLEFDYELDLEKGAWHHKGLSSKGSPIYEIWTSRSML